MSSNINEACIYIYNSVFIIIQGTSLNLSLHKYLYSLYIQQVWPLLLWYHIISNLRQLIQCRHTFLAITRLVFFCVHSFVCHSEKLFFPQQQKEWKDFGKNTDTVGQLWVNMLRYYTEIFNWKDHVVTIRQLAPLTRLQKLWNSRCIAIEDPFDLSHNLGAGLSRKSMFHHPLCN